MPNLPNTTSQILQRLAKKRATESIEEKKETNPQLWSYLQAASVLHCFSPDSLQPLDNAFQHAQPRLLLYDYIVNASGGLSEGLFTLKPFVRQEALARFASKETMYQALQCNPARVMTDLQKMWEDYLRSGSVPPAESLSYHDLTNLCQLVSWMASIDNELPSQEYIKSVLKQKSVLASFEHLVISNFTGRRQELDKLNRHVGAASSASGPVTIQQKVYSWFSSTKNTEKPEKPEKPILAIYGPGGIGKSALVGRMLWEQAKLEKEKRVPFAYLTFDQSSLRIETPFTLLVEASAQFELQIPEKAEAFRRFNDTVRSFRDTKGAIKSRTDIIINSRAQRIEKFHDTDFDLYNHFARLLKEICIRNNEESNILLVFDTFEEVQYRNRESLAEFWQMLEIIGSAFSLLSVVIIGRSSVSELGINKEILEESELKQLDIIDRVSLLLSLGVPDKDLATAIANQVGGNPLSLRLAANVVTSEAEAVGSSGIKDLNTRKWLIFQADDQIIQGQLYRRILAHIHDDRVRKLAHPGMVLRITSPEIILNVLAPVCKIAVNDLWEATQLFEELKREHALVRTGDSGTLEYRPEIRQSMIKLLKQDKYGEVRELNRAAIAWYSGHENPGARAEEIYHRLVSGEEDFAELDRRWIKGLEQSISANLDEYSDRVKVWLAARMDIEVSRNIFQNADILEWERNITRKVKRALTTFNITVAMALLGERDDRSEESPLFALEAKTYLLINELGEAEVILDKGVKQISSSSNRGRLAELFWLQAQIALLRQNPLLADQKLNQAEKAIERANNPIPLIQVLCHRLLMRDKYPFEAGETVTFLTTKLNTACEQINEEIAYAEPFVVNLAIPFLANEYPKTGQRLNAYSAQAAAPPPFRSSEILITENLRGLEEFTQDWEEEEDNRLFESVV